MIGLILEGLWITWELRMIKSRAEIKDFIVSLESKYPVNSWKFNGIHLWPILRIDIFFF